MNMELIESYMKKHEKNEREKRIKIITIASTINNIKENLTRYRLFTQQNETYYNKNKDIDKNDRIYIEKEIKKGAKRRGLSLKEFDIFLCFDEWQHYIRINNEKKGQIYWIKKEQYYNAKYNFY